MTTTTDHSDLRTTYSYVKCSKKITKVLIVLIAPPNNAHTPNPCYRAQRALSLAQSNLTSTAPSNKGCHTSAKFMKATPLLPCKLQAQQAARRLDETTSNKEKLY